MILHFWENGYQAGVGEFYDRDRMTYYSTKPNPFQKDVGSRWKNVVFRPVFGIPTVDI